MILTSRWKNTICLLKMDVASRTELLRLETIFRVSADCSLCALNSLSGKETRKKKQNVQQETAIPLTSAYTNYLYPHTRVFCSELTHTRKVLPSVLCFVVRTSMLMVHAISLYHVCQFIYR